MFKKVRLFTLFILSTVLTLTIIYNSCSSQSVKNIKFSKILSSFLQDFRVEIKNGSYSTKVLKDIPVSFKVPTKNSRGEVIDYEMKISQTPDCSGGEWEPYQKETTWTFQSDEEEEKLLFIYVKFRERRSKEVNYIFETKDFGETQGESKCTYDSIVHDTIPPRNLKWSYKPAKRTSQKKAEFRFTAEDYSPIHFQCQLKKSELNPSLNNPEEALWASCAPGISYDSSNFRQEGEYTFFLRAKDLSGNTSSILKYPWTIDSMAPSLSFPSCPQDAHFSSSTQISSISVVSYNLTPPVSLYCEKNPEQSCGTIHSSQTPATIDSSHFIEEDLNDGRRRKTLKIKALIDPPRDYYSEPIECSWYVNTDTTPPRIEFVTSPTHSYGTSTELYFQSDPFKIRIYDNRLRDQQSYSGTKIKYRVYTGNNNNTLLTSTCNNRIGNWCELPLDQHIENVYTDDSDNIYADTKPIHITQGLQPGINMAANEHRIEIQFEDTAGRTSDPIEKTWDVYGQVEEFSTIQSISGTSEGKADILFVLDDSGSMSAESEELGASFSGIISSLSDLNWQIAVTTMEQEHTKFGKLVQLISNTDNRFLPGQYILSSQETCSSPLYCSSNKSELEAIFKRTITEGSSGENHFTFTGDKEYGIQSVHALLDYFNNSPISATITNLPSGRRPLPVAERNAIQLFLRRGDSTFVVIFITDEGNCDNRTNIACHTDNMNKPQNLINKVSTIFGDDKKFISYPIIPVRGEGFDNYPGPDTVEDDYLELAKATQRRQSESGDDQVIWVDVNSKVELSNPLVQGFDSDPIRRSLNTTCPNIPRDAGVYTTDLCAISKDILKVTSHTIQLNCTPIGENLATGIHPPKYFYSPTLNATSNDHAFSLLDTNTNGVVLIQSGNRLILDGQPTPGTYKVKYFCYSDQIRFPTN